MHFMDITEQNQLETDLIKNFNYYISNFDSAISGVSIADYKKIYVPPEKIEALKKYNLKLTEPYKLPFDYNFIFSYAFPVSPFPRLYLDAVFIDNTAAPQKVYALVGSDRQFVVAFNKQEDGKVIACPDCFEPLGEVLPVKTLSNIEIFISVMIAAVNQNKLQGIPLKINSYAVT